MVDPARGAGIPPRIPLGSAGREPAQATRRRRPVQDHKEVVVRVGLAIMVKTPGHSPVKACLAADTGPDFADEWHGRSADCVSKVARACRDTEPHWAVAELSAFAAGAWQGLPCLLQGAGDMGQRMASVHTQLMANHDAAILIGADLPQLTAELLSQAAYSALLA